MNRKRTAAILFGGIGGRCADGMRTVSLDETESVEFDRVMGGNGR